MSQISKQFRCPFCGQHAPIERLTEEGPFTLAEFEKTLGGREKLTPEEREVQKKRGYRRAHVPGKLEYEEIPLDDDIREAAARRREEIEV